MPTCAAVGWVAVRGRSHAEVLARPVLADDDRLDLDARRLLSRRDD